MAEQVWIGNDHGGLALKRRFVEEMAAMGLEAHNVGADEPGIVRYPYYAAQVAEAVSTGAARRGILVCSTGIGMSIVANKFRGIRASVCTSTYTARMTRAHNDSNILCVGGKTVGEFEAIDMLHTWLTTPYEGGRHDISLGMLADAEKVLVNVAEWHPDPCV